MIKFYKRRGVKSKLIRRIILQYYCITTNWWFDCFHYNLSTQRHVNKSREKVNGEHISLISLSYVFLYILYVDMQWQLHCFRSLACERCYIHFQIASRAWTVWQVPLVNVKIHSAANKLLLKINTFYKDLTQPDKNNIFMYVHSSAIDLWDIEIRLFHYTSVAKWKRDLWSI